MSMDVLVKRGARMDDMLFESGGKELLARVKPLWEKLNWHHLLNNTYFKHYYATFTFDSRQKQFLNESNIQKAP